MKNLQFSCKHDHPVWRVDPKGHAAANETGWHCPACGVAPGEPPGYSPELDKRELQEKVASVLMALHNAGIVYVSNGSAGDGIAHAVAGALTRTGDFDQYTIARSVLDLMHGSHQEYWRKVGDGIRAGKDTRERCACGKLADVWSGGVRQCSGCWTAKLGECPF
jgi:hypothetical protein